MVLCSDYHRWAVWITVHHMYVGDATPKFEEFDHKKQVLTVTPIFHRLLQSIPLVNVYSDPIVFPTISRIPGSSQM